MVRDGIPFVLAPLFLSIICFAAGFSAGLFFLFAFAVFTLIITAFMAYFFRDPERNIPAAPGLVVAPADGKVTRVEQLSPGQPDSPTLVSIFLSPLDVHVNRSPIAGAIKDVTYSQGKYLMATKPESSLLNEQNSLTIEGEQLTIVCKQIAGILARRIVCWKKPGDVVNRGERFGLIKFSSRTDLILPPQVAVAVSVGARVKGGESIIGQVRYD